MSRRQRAYMNGERYCGNIITREVHDLDNEKTNCQIDQIIEAGRDSPFDRLGQAHVLGYDDCKWCLGGSTG